MSAGLHAEASRLVLWTAGRETFATGIDQVAHLGVVPVLGAAGATRLDHRLAVRNRKAARRRLQGAASGDRPGFCGSARTSSDASWSSQATAVLADIGTPSGPMLPRLTSFGGYDHDDVAGAGGRAAG